MIQSSSSQKFARSLHGIKRKMPSGRHGRPALVDGHQIQSLGGCKFERLLALMPTIAQPSKNIFRNDTVGSHDRGEKSRRCSQKLKHPDSVERGSLRRNTQDVGETMSKRTYHSTSTLVGQKRSAWKGEPLASPPPIKSVND